MRRKDAIHSLRHLEWFRRFWRGATDCFGRWRGRSRTGRASLRCDRTHIGRAGVVLVACTSAPYRRIGETEVRLALRRAVESAGKTIEDAALGSAARAADGSAYMLQLVGYFAWEEAWGRETLDPASVARGIEEARDDFSRGVLDVAYREMSRSLIWTGAPAPDQTKVANRKAKM